MLRLLCFIELTLLPFECCTQWENAFFNFDSVGEGMLTLFTVATLEGKSASAGRLIRL